MNETIKGVKNKLKMYQHVPGLMLERDEICSLITTIEQKDQFNVELCKQILAHETTIESQKEEIENLRDDYGVIFYELNRLEVQLELPKRGYLRNCLENLINLAKTHKQEGDK